MCINYGFDTTNMLFSDRRKYLIMLCRSKQNLNAKS